MTVSEMFETMDYGKAPESPAEALAWLVDNGDRFGHFIDGDFTDPTDSFESKNPANGNVLATLSQATQADVDAAVKAARRAQPKWAALGGHGRARYNWAWRLDLVCSRNTRCCFSCLLLDWRFFSISQRGGV